MLVNDSHGRCTTSARRSSIRGPRCSRARRSGRWSPARGLIAGSGSPCSSGYHARAGNPQGTIAHTYSSRPVRSTLNGTPAGEAGSTRSRSGRGACPSASIAGDDVLAAEMADWFPWAERVVVKEGFGRHAAASVHPTVARERIRAAAERAVRRAIAGELRPLVLDPPYAIEVTYQNALQADYACLVPGAERIGDTGARFSSDDPVLAYRGFLAGLRLAGLVD